MLMNLQNSFHLSRLDGNSSPQGLWQNGKIWLSLLGLYLVSLLILSPLLPGVMLNLPKEEELKVGTETNRMVVADRNYTFIDYENTQKRRDARVKLVRPVYRIQEELTFQVLSQYDEAVRILKKFLQDPSKKDIVMIELEAYLPRLNTRQILDDLERQRLAAENYLIQQREMLNVALERGVIGGSIQEIPTQGIEIRLRRGAGDIRQFYTREQVQTLAAMRSSLGSLAGQLVTANASLDQQATDEARNQVLATTPPVTLSFQKGEAILERGEIITEEKRLRLTALYETLWREFWGKFIVMIIALALILGLGYLTLRQSFSVMNFQDNITFFLVAVWILNLIFNVGFILMGQPNLRLLFSPIGLSILITVLLTNQLTGVVMSFILTLPLMIFLPDGNWGDLGLPAALSAFVFDKAEKRFSVFISGIIYGLLLSTFLIISQIWNQSLNASLYLVGGVGLLNGLISSVIGLGLLPVLEYAFNFSTRFRMQELSDLNSPILKKMLGLAPGTYAHSINVSHLAENAARAVGADPLLARVGAIYHDIGKIDQAEFFVENQRGQNPHDVLNPKESAAIIKNHVSEGVEKAKELRLPQKVIDIIKQHHGLGLIEYFYNKALQQSKSTVDIKDYQYSGPNPQFREAGIVMLADTIEAASRTLQSPDYHFLEEFIEKLVNKKIEEGLLIESGLTLNDLKTIQVVILHALAGQFHSRIEYVERPNGNRS